MIAKKSETRLIQKSELSEEIGFVDIARIFLKRKKLFIASFLVFWGLGLIYTFFFYIPQYHFSSYIQVAGYYDESTFISIADPQNLIFQIQKNYLPRFLKSYYLANPNAPKMVLSTKVAQDESEIQNAPVNPQNTIIQLNIVGPKLQQNVYSQLVQSFLLLLREQEYPEFDRARVYMQQKRDGIQEQLKLLSDIRQSWSKELEEQASIVESIHKGTVTMKNADVLRKFISQYMTSNLQNNFVQLIIQENNFTQSLIVLQHQLGTLEQSHILNMSDSENLIGLNQSVLMLLMFMGAIFGAAFLVLMAEFFSKVPRE